MPTLVTHALHRTARPLAGLALLLSSTLAAQAEPPATIPFDALDKAAARGQTQRRVIVVYFTADWCGWCKRMSSATFTDPGVLALADRFAWAKVDTDAEPGSAARFGVRGLPTVMWFNADGAYLGERNGYVAPGEMAELLESYKGKAEAAGAAERKMALIETHLGALKRAEGDEAVSAAVAGIVATVATQRTGREAVRRALHEAGPAAWPALIGHLESERLAHRAAAYDLVTELTGHDAPFDPFAEADTRRPQVARWRAWHTDYISRADSNSARSPAPQPEAVE